MNRITPLLLVCVLAVAVLGSGCKTGSGSSVVSPALTQSFVASGVRYGVTKWPSSKPAVAAGVEVVCSVGNGTNLNPAVIVAAVDSSNFAALKTPEAVLIMEGVIGAYTLIWNSYGADAINNAPTLKLYLQATCNGGREGLAPLTLRSVEGQTYQVWPHLK